MGAIRECLENEVIGEVITIIVPSTDSSSNRLENYSRAEKNAAHVFDNFSALLRRPSIKDEFYIFLKVKFVQFPASQGNANRSMNLNDQKNCFKEHSASSKTSMKIFILFQLCMFS